MAKGENIFKRKDGRWEARYIKGHDLAGRIQYGFCYGKTYCEAKEKVTKLKAALVLGKTPPPVSRHRLSFYCDEWLRQKQPRVRESTYETLAQVLKVRVAVGEETLYDGRMKDMPGGVATSLHAAAPTTEEILYTVTAYLDTSVGNAYQNAALVADFR